jgi:hypothetical protein
MNAIQPSYKERVRYIMYNDSIGTLILQTDPIGWNSDNKEYARNENYHGIVAKFSNSLVFIDDGAEFINMVYDTQDIIGQIRLVREMMHPQTDVWTREYWGYLDLSTREVEDNGIKVKFNAGSLEEALKSRESDEIEIDRVSTIDGKPIPELSTQVVALDGRRIFLKSIWKENTINNYTTISVTSDDGNTRDATASFPLTLTSKSHEEAQSNIGLSYGNEVTGAGGLMLLNSVDRDRTIVLKGSNITFTPILIDNDYQWVDFRICVTVYQNGTDYDLKDRYIKFYRYGEFHDDNDIISMLGVMQSVADFEQTIELAKGDSLAVEVFLKSDLIFGSNKRVTFDLTQSTGNFAIEEDSHFEPTQAKAVLVHELGDRIATICTNRTGVFKSDYFGRTDIGYTQDGPGAYNAVTHGFWVRGFDKLPISDDNRFKPLTTSWQNMIESLHAIHNVTVGIESFNNNESIRIEPMKHFYQPFVTIKLPNQVKNVKRKVALDKYCSSIEIGYETGGTYEEAQGLDEYNAKSKFTTIITKAKNFLKISKFRADSYGMEFARRKPLLGYPTTDTSYDSDVFILDLKKDVTPILKQRKWQDDFEVIPTGTFSPETATNLRFSPFNMMLRHGWNIASSFLKYPQEFIRYASSTANSKLATKRIGSNEYLENGNIVGFELDKAYFFPEEITFEHKVDFEIIQKLDGFTTLPNGKRIPNLYGMFEFTNEKNEIERGWFLNIKPNGNGEFTLIKSNL